MLSSKIEFQVTIRSGQENDYESLDAIKRDATRLFGSDYVTTPLGEENFGRYLAENSLQVLVNNGREVCGYSAAFRIESDLHLHHLFIANAYGGRGLGTLLLREVIERAAKTHSRAVTLITSGSAPWNGPFYAKHGFQYLDEEMPAYMRTQLDEQIKYFDPDLPMMKKTPFLLPRVAMERVRSYPF